MDDYDRNVVRNSLTEKGTWKIKDGKFKYIEEVINSLL